MHPQTAAALADLTKILQDMTRLRKRLVKINTYQIPVYWSVSPLALHLLTSLQYTLEEDLADLQKIKHL